MPSILFFTQASGSGTLGWWPGGARPTSGYCECPSSRRTGGLQVLVSCRGLWLRGEVMGSSWVMRATVCLLCGLLGRPFSLQVTIQEERVLSWLAVLCHDRNLSASLWSTELGLPHCCYFCFGNSLITDWTHLYLITLLYLAPVQTGVYCLSPVLPCEHVWLRFQFPFSRRKPVPDLDTLYSPMDI